MLVLCSSSMPTSSMLRILRGIGAKIQIRFQRTRCEEEDVFKKCVSETNNHNSKRVADDRTCERVAKRHTSRRINELAVKLYWSAIHHQTWSDSSELNESGWENQSRLEPTAPNITVLIPCTSQPGGRRSIGYPDCLRTGPHVWGAPELVLSLDFPRPFLSTRLELIDW